MDVPILIVFLCFLYDTEAFWPFSPPNSYLKHRRIPISVPLLPYTSPSVQQEAVIKNFPYESTNYRGKLPHLAPYQYENHNYVSPEDPYQYKGSKEYERPPFDASDYYSSNKVHRTGNLPLTPHRYHPDSGPLPLPNSIRHDEKGSPVKYVPEHSHEYTIPNYVQGHSMENTNKHKNLKDTHVIRKKTIYRENVKSLSFEQTAQGYKPGSGGKPGPGQEKPGHIKLTDDKNFHEHNSMSKPDHPKHVEDVHYEKNVHPHREHSEHHEHSQNIHEHKHVIHEPEFSKNFEHNMFKDQDFKEDFKVHENLKVQEDFKGHDNFKDFENLKGHEEFKENKEVKEHGNFKEHGHFKEHEDFKGHGSFKNHDNHGYDEGKSSYHVEDQQEYHGLEDTHKRTNDHGAHLDHNGLKFVEEAKKVERGNPKGRISFQIHGQNGPHSYRFGYDTGKGYNRQFRYEERDNYGEVKGRFGFYDEHGKLRVTNYSAHPKHGYHADVPKP